MKKSVFCLLIIFSIMGCCRDQIVSTYKIPVDQQYLIPFEQDAGLTYISQQNIAFSANAKQKKIEILEERSGPDSCNLWVFDVLKSSIFINIFELKFEFILSGGFNDDELILSMKRLFKSGSHQDYRIVNANGQNHFSEDLFTEIEINGFTFNNVLIFKTSLLSEINQVIYSAENGIEYIDFDDGRYLKLNRQ